MKSKPVLSLSKKDFKVDKFCSGGHGGQHQNRRKMAIRITHIATGISAECRNYKSQLQNKKEAFLRLCKNKRFKLWLKQKTLEILDVRKTIEQQVEEAMQPENLKIEIRENNKWIKSHN